jgi:hypothetical protein
MRESDSISLNVDLNGFNREQIFTVQESASGEDFAHIQTHCFGYRHLVLKVEPWKGNHHIMVVWDCPEPSENDCIWPGRMKGIWHDYFPNIIEGIQDYTSARIQGLELPGPLIRIRITIVGGSVSPMDSRPTNYKIAAFIALRKAIDKAGRILLAE